MKYLFWFLGIVFAGNAFAQNINPKTGKPWAYPDMDSVYRVCIGTKYVPFDVITLEGKKFNNDSCLHKVTFINFWFEGCQPCREEFGKLNELYDSLKDNPTYQFVAITFDRKETLPDFIRKTGIRYPIATVADKIESKRLNYTMGYPSSIILDRGGTIRFIEMKGIADQESSYKVALHRVLSVMKSLL